MAEFRRSTMIPHLEARRSCREGPCYRLHAHDAFSIGAVDAGTSALTGPLDGRIRLRTGDVVVIPAEQVHACNPDRGRWRYQMIHMSQAWAAALAPRREPAPPCDGIRVLRDPELYAQVGAASDAILSDEAPEPLEARFAALLTGIAEASPAHLVRSAAEPELLARLTPVMQRLRTEESNPLLGDLAEEVGMTKRQLIRTMRGATGLTPLAWRQNARVSRARRMLREGLSIAETAHALGFTDQGHLHRVFRAHVAASPGSYRG